MNRYLNTLARMSQSFLYSGNRIEPGNRGFVEPIHEERRVQVEPTQDTAKEVVHGSESPQGNSETMNQHMNPFVKSKHIDKISYTEKQTGVADMPDSDSVSVPRLQTSDIPNKKNDSLTSDPVKTKQQTLPSSFKAEGDETNHDDSIVGPPSAKNYPESELEQNNLLNGTGPDLKNKNKTKISSPSEIREESKIIYKTQSNYQHKKMDLMRKVKKRLGTNSIQIDSKGITNSESIPNIQNRNQNKDTIKKTTREKVKSHGDVFVEEQKVFIDNRPPSSEFETPKKEKPGIFKEARVLTELPEAKTPAHQIESSMDPKKKNQSAEPLQAESQELNLSIGSINVTVEGAQPDLAGEKPFQTQYGASDHGIFSSTRLNRHYIFRG